jgi:hypothetical protein
MYILYVKQCKQTSKLLLYMIYVIHLLFAQIKTSVVNAFKWNCIFNLLHARSSSFDFFLAF